ncbi:MAG: methyltransferase domain-containing protein [Terriglobia bacterium]
MSFLTFVCDKNRKLNDRFFPRSQKRYVDRFRELAAELSVNAERLLHLGAGSNDLSPCISVRQAGLNVINLDLSFQEMQKNPGKLRICADGQDLPLASRSVDLICSEHVFEHFPDPQRVLEECCRVLVDGGYLVVSGPNGWSYVALVARVTPVRFHKLVHRLGSSPSGNEADPWPTFYRFSTPLTIRRLARNTGFDVVSMQTFVGEPCYTICLPLLHLAFMAYHKLLEKLNPIFNFHITSVAALRKVAGKK